MDATMTDREYREREHRFLCHSDGSECPDGCNAAPLKCQCETAWSEGRVFGWLRCARCHRMIA